ncbi:related to ubiquitin-protein ligase HUL4 [Rhynchosporium agropyri]|uniref:HECT-type E3 ubiquitin transferase n=1 Tax=Rhynchosporium agropyri TaxID=914238 RepID=A0A1E1KKS5_9HELO|nr:related to ubiquitin-protein ligase HUL4 [Rhynchosporium agropyri]
MPPWSSRLLSPSTRNETGPNAVNGPLLIPESPARSRPRISEADILNNAYGIPTLPPPSHANHGASKTSKPIRTLSHGRSMSHPFPSLFSTKKKRHDESAQVAGCESTDEDSVSPLAARNIIQNPTSNQKGPDKDLMNGKCMTCDSMVRWPKELKVFRCTVCLTINDLKPITLEARRGDGHRAPVAAKAGICPRSGQIHKVAPLSIGRTRQIVDQCITTYLIERLKHDEESNSDPTPLQSSTWQITPKGEAIKAQKAASNRKDNIDLEDNRPLMYSKELSITQTDGYPGSTNSFAFDPQQVDALLYSKSSPGSFLDAHMEQRDKGPHSNFQRLGISNDREAGDSVQRNQFGATNSIFKPLEDYIISSFGSFECVNSSFSTTRPNLAPRAQSEGIRRTVTAPLADRSVREETELSEMDAKTLLIGDFAENGSWWTGNRPDLRSPERSQTHRVGDNDTTDIVTLRSPRVDWSEVNEWYHLVLNAGKSWRKKLEDTSETHVPKLKVPSALEMYDIEDRIMEAQYHVQRILLNAIESLLKRPGRPLKDPSDLRFILIILTTPLLYPSQNIAKPRTRSRSRSRDKPGTGKEAATDSRNRGTQTNLRAKSDANRGSTGQHSGIIKRILGLLSNVPNECHHHLVSWFARFSDGQFQRTTDLIGSFVTYRLTRQHGKKREVEQDPTSDLVPSISGSGRATSAALHAALGAPGQSSKKKDGKPKPVLYNDDWQIKAAARVMALVFAANNSGLARRGEVKPVLATLSGAHSAGLAARDKAHSHGQILPTSDFYNTLLDYSDLIADFEAWESKRGKFAFCQYPFFLSIWAKIQIMEHDAKRQMEVKAREAFFDSIMTRKSVNQYLVLKIRRDCLVEDSLKGVGEVVGTGGEEIKKGLRIEFRGEEGIDAGGLRKEWFLLLVRDVFNPEHGMFAYDDDSGFCYFNPNSFETTDQFFLVGVVLGLAIYNSTILDVALPPFAFRKLLAAAPPAAPGATSHAKPSMTYSLEDLAEYRPTLARGLRQLLDFEGDVEATFCRDFVADVDRYGQIIQIPLCPDGETKAVTNSNRREFVDLYVRYLLDTAVTRQFEPFKRGFFTVCGGNALSLFRPEEIELLIRGSDEPLDIASLRAVSVCDNWKVPNAAETEPVVQWFWQSFQAANPKDQRKLLSFITGSDRIPAMGATNLVIKVSCLGDDCPRFPVARTCFNMISLWRYGSKEKLEHMLWRAVNESEGFGLK